MGTSYLTLINAIMSFYPEPAEAAKAAVCWSSAASLRPSLSLCASQDPMCLSLGGLEKALLTRNAVAVEALLYTQALTAKYVRLDKLVDDPAFKSFAIAEANVNAQEVDGRSRRSGELIFAATRKDRKKPARCQDSAYGFSMFQAILTPHEPSYTADLRLRWHASIEAEACAKQRALRDMRVHAGADTKMPIIEEARLEPSWLELMAWAIVIGERRMAKALWTETDQPLRAAIIAARLARHLANTSFGRAAKRYSEDADAYEEMAVGVLNSATGAEAHLMLLGTDAEYGASQRSCLELATDSNATGCRHVCNAPAVVETLQLLFSGFIAPIPPQFELRPPKAKTGRELATRVTMERIELARIHEPVPHDVNEWCDKVHAALSSRLVGGRIFYDSQAGGNAAAQVVSVLTAPLLKFALHATARLAYFITLSVTISMLPYENLDGRGLLDPSRIPMSEYVVWVWTGCAVVEQLKQLLRKGRRKFMMEGTAASCCVYFEELGSLREFAGHIFLLLAAALRVGTRYNLFDAFDSTVLEPQRFLDARLGWAATLYSLALFFAGGSLIGMLMAFRGAGTFLLTLGGLALVALPWLAIVLVVLTAVGVALLRPSWPLEPEPPLGQAGHAAGYGAVGRL